MKKDRWFDWTEYALLLGSGAGAVASVATQQALLAAAPLSLLAALGLISRRQLQTQLSQSQSVMVSVNSRLDKRLHDVQEQLTELPTHGHLSAMRQSTVAQTKQDILSLSQVIEHTRKKLTSQIDEKEFPELQELREYLVELQERYTELSIDFKDVKSRCQRLSDMSRVEATETMVAKLETELMQLKVHLESLGANAKNNYTGLNDRLTYLKQQVQQLTTEERQSLLKGEVQKLVQTVSGMVSRNEFLELTTRLTESTADKLILQELQTQSLDRTEQFQQRLERLEQHLEGMTDSILEAVAETVEPSQAGAASVAQLQKRLDATDQQMGMITGAVLEAVSETLEPFQTTVATSVANSASDWLLDFDSPEGMSSGGMSNSRQALEQLLSQTRERLVLVWPWADSVVLDDSLLQQFRQLLERNCRLDMGWCHQGEHREHPLLRNISQRWCENSTRHQHLKQALNQLLPLKQEYPDLFSFKILGTTENFAVCDAKYALVGMRALPTQTSLFPTVKLKLRTTDPSVIRPLLQRFENPAIDADDAGAFFNRGVTRYDIRDCNGAIEDFTQVINIRPSAAAYNSRGVAWVEIGDYARALQDFGHAIRLDARLFAARCNRGVLRMTVRDYGGALSDFDVAVDLRPQSAVPYFYQGQALQFLGDLQ
ncbi:hypothetical protein IQ260_16525 [Leptolyngbya cf. ectocarpi LEGE 11479]|uniref:Tetratricopeptide repeat protein n=1 Tax=Leptolyngbya cf. ectocarpi LEGE 11479 TaxID=1828722 RepID=A0A929FAY1_LEPEC|nr:hypothetical protein [Leptolyngbya ectocarpi]MBE9068258.1 hypothetical protein [Leptolyngbya cf. ectocarpi LEGE 11479]